MQVFFQVLESQHQIDTEIDPSLLFALPVMQLNKMHINKPSTNLPTHCGVMTPKIDLLLTCFHFRLGVDH